MATGVSGAAVFTGSGKTLRVYYTQSFTPGVGVSTLTISRVTVQAAYTYGGSFFFDGAITVNGQTVFSASVAASDGCVGVTTEESIINCFTGGSVRIAHTEATDITIGLRKNRYGSPYFYHAGGGGFSMTAGDRTVRLAAIPMASVIAAEPVTLGEEMTIRLTRLREGLTDTLRWSCGTASGEIARDSTGTEFTFTPPPELAAQAPADTAVPLTLTVETKSGSDSAGSSACTLRCPIPASVVPTLTVTIADDTDCPARFGSFVCGQSRVRVQARAEGVYGAEITAVTLCCGELTRSAAEAVFLLSEAGQIPVTVTAADSRGRTAVFQTAITAAAYSLPVPELTALYRCDETGAADPSGSWARAEGACRVTALNGANAARGTLRYRPRGDTDWTELPLAAGIFPADPDRDYQVCLVAADSFAAVTGSIRLLPAAFALLDLDRTNRAVGIGQRAGTADTVSLGLPLKMGLRRITDLGEPSADSDGATRNYVNLTAAAAAPTNRLDNSDFGRAVNLRGTGGGWLADRWSAALTDNASLTLIEGTGVTLYPGNGRCVLGQAVEDCPAGELCTVVLEVTRDGTEAAVHGVLTPGGAETPLTGDGAVTAGLTEDGRLSLSFTGGETRLRRAALYVGEFACPPGYRARGYGAEIAACRRYYRCYRSETGDSLVLSGYVTNSRAWLLVTLPDSTPMRRMPTLSFSGKIVVRGVGGYADGTSYSGISGAVMSWMDTESSYLPAIKIVQGSGDAWGLTNNTPVSVQLLAGFRLTLDAEESV